MHVALDGLTSDPISANRGIIAGAGAATYEAEMFVTPVVNTWLGQTTEERLPTVGLATLAVHIDDLGLNVAPPSFHACVQAMYDRASSLAAL
eukprot:4034035-Pyramimonas_sp.AAC.1